MKDNLDAVERSIVSTAARLAVVHDEMIGWKQNYEGDHNFAKFEEQVFSKKQSSQYLTRSLYRAVQKQLTKLYQLRDESIVRKVVDFEDEKSRIARIIENVDEARILFQVRRTSVIRLSSPDLSPPRSCSSASGHLRRYIRSEKISEFVKFICSMGAPLTCQTEILPH